MTAMRYADLLRHPLWQKKRLEVLEAAGWRCSACESTEKTLNVHHKIYLKGRKPWEYENKQLQVLCDDCHEAAHGVQQALLDAASRLAANDSEIATGYMVGLDAQSRMDLDEEIGVSSFEFAIGLGDTVGVSPQDIIDRLVGSKISFGVLLDMKHEDGFINA